MDPRTPQQTVVGGVNIHYLEGNLTGVRADLYREIDLSPNLSAGAVEGTNYHGTWLLDASMLVISEVLSS